MSSNNYIVSALKYRPSEWDAVVGQKTITDTLQQAITTGQLAKAYLFWGPRGVPRRDFKQISSKI